MILFIEAWQSWTVDPLCGGLAVTVAHSSAHLDLVQPGRVPILDHLVCFKAGNVFIESYDVLAGFQDDRLYGWNAAEMVQVVQDQQAALSSVL
jgi:hypothetical protein